MRPIYRAIARFATFLLLAAAFASHAKEPDDLGPDTWPKTLDAAVTVAIQQLPPAEQARLKAMKREDLIRLHHGYGTGLRNYLGLWRGNKDLIVSACGHPCHPDDASMKIIEAIWDKLQKQP
jgi:hypothetical protein